VLYLATTPEGVRLEIAGSGAPVFLQVYRIDFGTLRIADLAATSVTEFLKAAFDQAEMSMYANFGRPDYLFSQLLAELVSDAGYDGMLVPGVRGHHRCRYENLVLFRPDGWQEWSAREGGFNGASQE